MPHRLPACAALLLFYAVTPAVRAQCRFSTGAGRAITFTFQYSASPAASAPSSAGDSVPGATLRVSLTFRGSDSGSEQIVIPTEWAGQPLHAVTNLRALSPGTTIQVNSTPGRRILHYPPDARVVIAYDLAKDWSGPLVHPFQFHPVIRPEYFEIAGANALVYPAMDDSAQVTAAFDWHGLPDDWALATSFGAGTYPQDRCQSYAGVWKKVADAVFAAGDFRLRHFTIGPRAAVLAVRGTWPFTDEEAIADIRKVIQAVRDFWHDDRFPYFLVTLKPYDTDHGSTDGTAFTNAFWLYSSRLDPLSDQLPVMAHETFHAWDPKEMGASPIGEEARLGWFQEGFTQYYAYLLLYRAGLMDLPTYIGNVNQDLRRYSGSNDVYIRGRVIALWLDGEIREESGGRKTLDDLMFDMVHRADQPFTLKRVYETAGHYLGVDALRRLEDAVANGSDLPMPADAALGGCPSLTSRPDPVFAFDLGLDVATTRRTNRISGVDPGGPAFKAGLRDGQEIGGRVSVYNGDADKIAIFTIGTPEGPRAIQYYPRGKSHLTPQYHLNERTYAGNPSACRK